MTTPYERALAESIVKHYYAICEERRGYDGRKPVAIRLQHSELASLIRYVDETMGPIVVVNPPPVGTRILGMAVIEVVVAPTDPRERFIFGG